MSWERFKDLINTGPDLTIQDPNLLQQFYMGLNKETSKFLDIASGGSFLHISTNLGRNILDKILENTPLPEEVEEKLLEEESQIAEPESLPNPSQTSVVPNPEPMKKEETPILDFMLEFKDELFTEYENTSKYHTMRKPQKLQK
jgi:hypothetical protein